MHYEMARSMLVCDHVASRLWVHLWVHLVPFVQLVVFREKLATMFTPGVHVADNNNARGFPADGSVGHGVHTLCIPASSYGRITPFV